MRQIFKSIARSLAVLALLSMTLSTKLTAQAAPKPSPQSSPKPTGQATVGSVRHLHFPAAGIGSLYFVRDDDGAGKTATKHGKFCAFAKGDVTVTVPEHKVLMLEVNAFMFKHPELVKEISSTGIDSLLLTAANMEDEVNGSPCRQIMLQIDHFKDLRYLSLDHSDVTDADLQTLKSQPNLQTLSLFMTQVDGSFLKNITNLKKLTFIDLDSCAIKPQYLAYLSNFPLTHLNLNQTNLGPAGAKFLSQCPTVTLLQIVDNPRFDDSCLKYLLTMKQLCVLDVRFCGVTARGLGELKTLHPIRIQIGGKIYPAADLAGLKTIMPATSVQISKRTLRAEDVTMFAPMH